MNRSRKWIWLLVSCLCVWASLDLFVLGQEEAKVTPPINKKVKVTSLTLYPVSLANQKHQNIAEVIGVMLEKEGFQNIEISETAYEPAQGENWQKSITDFGTFVGKSAIKTDFAFYGEILASREKGFYGVRGVIADKKGKIVWSESQTEENPEFRREKPDCPMSSCVFLSQRILPLLETTEPLAEGEEGALERRLRERSGLPGAEEYEAMEIRLLEMKKTADKYKVWVYPIRVGKKVDREAANYLVDLIKEKNLMKAEAAQEDPWFDIKPNSNEQQILWDMAKAFKAFVQKKDRTTDYFLYADFYVDQEKKRVGAVHFVLCDSEGEWVIVDYQNSHHEDFQAIAPASVNDCIRLALKRLERYLK